jgi:hypothetical protein
VRQTYTLNITGANDAPTRVAPNDIRLSPAVPNVSVNFNQFDFSGQLSATDPDSGAITFTVTSQSNPGLFTISGTTLSANDIGTNTTLTVSVRATQVGDPLGVFTEETFTVITGSNGNSGDPLNGASGDDVLYGNNGNDILMGFGGNDALFGQDGNDNVQGGDGNDVLNGGGGSDTLTGGAGNDTFVLNSTLAANVDTITDYAFGDTIDITQLLSVSSGSNVITGGFVRVTTTGLIQIDANGSGVGGQVWTTVGNVNTGAGPYAITYLSGGVATTVNVTAVAPPIGLDLDGDGGVSFLGTDAGVTFDYGYGPVGTAWVAGNDGILARDANGDGQVTHDEIVFATSGSDLEGLSVYDTNHDGQLSSADAQFADFAVWQDANSDGRVDAGELGSLTAHSIASISLSSDGAVYAAAGGDVQVVGTGSFARTDGSTGVVADAVFATGSRSFDEQFKAAAGIAGTTAMTGAVAAAGLAAIASSPQGDGRAATESTPSGTAEPSSLAAIAASAADAGNVFDRIDNSTSHFADAERLPFDQANGSATGESNHSLMGADAVQAAAPAALLQGTEAPAPAMPSSSATFVAQAAIAIPPADSLAEAFQHSVAAGAMHTQELSRVLADALGGGSNGPSIDTLLASLPIQADGEWSTGLHVLADGGLAHASWDAGIVMPVIHLDLMAEAATHMDAVASA